MPETERNDGGGRTVAITGASGFVGGHLTQHLALRGHRVRPLLRRPIADLPGEPFYYQGVHDRNGIQAAADGASAVVHLAALVHRLNDRGDEEPYREVNVEGTRCVVEESIAAGVELVVLLSSVKAVGEQTTGRPWDESAAPAPQDPYGRSKLEAERLAVRLAEAAGVPAVVLRIPLVYGPGMGANMLRLFNAVQRGAPLPFGRVENKRSVLYIGNLTAAIEAVLTFSQPQSGVYFLSDGRDLSTADMTRAIASGFGRRPRLLPVPPLLLQGLGRIGDLLPQNFFGSAQANRLTASLQVTSSAFQERFRFAPPFTPEEALRMTAEQYRT